MALVLVELNLLVPGGKRNSPRRSSKVLIKILFFNYCHLFQQPQPVSTVRKIKVENRFKIFISFFTWFYLEKNNILIKIFLFFLTVQIYNGQHQEQPGLHAARPVLARRRAGRVRRAGVGRRGAAHVWGELVPFSGCSVQDWARYDPEAVVLNFLGGFAIDKSLIRSNQKRANFNCGVLWVGLEF